MKKEKIIFQGETQRIDKYLTEKFSYSRNFFHHIILRDGIYINGKSVKKSYKLKPGDSIQIDDLQRYLSPIILDEAPNIDIEILLEKEDFLVINKPKGVLSHPNSVRDINKASVVGFLYHRYKNLPSIGNFIRAGLVHRLDKDTDGVMLIAKTEIGLEHFKKLFQAKSESKSIELKEKVSLKKFYQAKCHISDRGKVFFDEISGVLPYYIIENVIPKTPNPTIKEGITKILDIEELKKDGFFKLDLEILTGRTHQIRYHLANHGFPIIGDYMYGIDKDGPVQLTAKKLIFVDIDGELIEISI